MSTGLGIDIGIASYARAKWAWATPAHRGQRNSVPRVGTAGAGMGLGPKTIAASLGKYRKKKKGVGRVTIALDSMRGEALRAARGHSGRRATPGGRGQSSQHHRVRKHGQRGNKSRVGLAGAGMESGRFAHGQRGGKSRAVFRAQGWREHGESRVGLACACAWTEGCSGRMRMGRGIANRAGA